LLLNLSQ
jgi:Oxidoreductase molybdopterin binding domain